MRTISSTERSFVTSLIKETKQLLKDVQLSVPQKVDRLDLAIKRHKARAKTLREAREQTHDSLRVKKLDQFISVREKAIEYLEATSNWISENQKNSLSLRQRPRTFVDPGWELPTIKGAPVTGRKEDFPFMDFSS